jgi:hypothetical protein
MTTTLIRIYLLVLHFDEIQDHGIQVGEVSLKKFVLPFAYKAQLVAKILQTSYLPHI